MADIIRTAVSGNGVDVQVEPFWVLKPTPPTVDVFVGDPSKGNEAAGFGDMAGEDMWTVRVRVGVNDYEENHGLLVDFMDQESNLCVPLALLDEPTLNGHATSLDVRSFSGLRLYPEPDGTPAHIGVEWGFIVIPARS
jgi:hypothetical protein